MNDRHVIKNDYLCGENIKFAMITDKLSNGLKGALVKKFNLINESQVIGYIENAVLSYYGFSLEDTIGSEDVNYDSYVYIYAHPLERGMWHIYGNEYLQNKPLYIGKGSGERFECHLKYSHNSELDKTIKSLTETGVDPIIKIYNKGCTGLMAHNLENYIISRLREQGVDLYNATLQADTSKHGIRDFIITSLNLEKAENQLIIDALNSTKIRKEAAAALGISERTLYRKIKSLGISEFDGVAVFTPNSHDFKSGMEVEKASIELKNKKK